MGDQKMPAPLRRRVGAGLIDALPFLIAIGAAVVTRIRRKKRFELPRPAVASVHVATLLATSWLQASQGATPGQRALGLRVVDAQTGGNLTFRRAILRNALRSASSLSRLVVGSRLSDTRRRQSSRADERSAAFQLKVKEVQEELAEDPEERDEAIKALYSENSINPWRACLDPQISMSVILTAAVYLPALRSPGRQGLHDRLSHAVVISTR